MVLRVSTMVKATQCTAKNIFIKFLMLKSLNDKSGVLKRNAYFSADMRYCTVYTAKKII